MTPQDIRRKLSLVTRTGLRVRLHVREFVQGTEELATIVETEPLSAIGPVVAKLRTVRLGPVQRARRIEATVVQLVAGDVVLLGENQGALRLDQILSLEVLSDGKA